MRLLPALLFAVVTFWTASAQTYTISTFAGGGLPVNIPAGDVIEPSGPQGVAVDKAGNVFFTDGGENIVVRLDATTGALSLAAGNGAAGFSGDNGPATSAQLSSPYGVAVDSAGNLYITDVGNARIRKVSNGVITTVAGNGTPGFSGDNGAATNAQLYNPFGVAVDSAGNIYIADSGNNRVRKVSNGVITTVAGGGSGPGIGDNGPATSAQLYNPFGVALDSAGNIYIADSGRIRKVSNGVITTVAGGGSGPGICANGPATGAYLFQTFGVAVDSAGNLYIASPPGDVCKVAGGASNIIVGAVNADQPPVPGIPSISGGPFIRGVAVDSAGNVYIADNGNALIEKLSGGVLTTVAGGSSLFGDNGPATGAQLDNPDGVAVDSAGNVYIAEAGINCVQKVAAGVISTVAGCGGATSTQLNEPQGVAVDSAGNLYIADTFNQLVRKVSNGVVTTVAGNGTAGFSGDNGPATSAQLNYPYGIAVDSSGNIYIADSGNNRVRRVSNGIITTVAGNGTAGFSGDNGPAASAQLQSPDGVAVDSSGNLYIADAANYRIRKVVNGVIATVAGNGTKGFSGDGGPATSAQLNGPYGVAVDSSGNVYIADGPSNRIRRLTPGVAPTITPNGIVPIYSVVPTIQPGAWVSIYGGNLASGTFLWNGNFPTSLGGTTVMIDNKPAYLWSVSPFQINLQAPDDAATGLVSVVVTTATGTATSTVTLAPYGPSFSLLGDNKHVVGEIATPNGTGAYANGTYDLVGPSNTFSYSTRPVNAGETLVLYGVGFGPTTPHVPAGQVFSGAAAPTSSPVTVTIGGVSTTAIFAGITEEGLYQINLTVPANTGSGDQAIKASVNGIQTPPGPVVTVQ